MEGLHNRSCLKRNFTKMLCNFHFLGSPCPDKVLQNLAKAFVLLNIFTRFYDLTVTKKIWSFRVIKKGRIETLQLFCWLSIYRVFLKTFFLGSKIFLYLFELFYSKLYFHTYVYILTMTNFLAKRCYPHFLYWNVLLLVIVCLKIRSCTF